MRRVRCVLGIAAASISILAGCGGQPADGQTVTGRLVRVGGPAGLGGPPPPLPLPGTVVARNAAGEQFTATTGKDGRFQLSLPPGAYRLTGDSPQVVANGQQMPCTAGRTLHVIKNRPVHGIEVVCSIA
jgi:hypothetical protein